MKIVASSVLGIYLLFGCVACSETPADTAPKVEVKNDTPEYQAYEKVQNLESVRLLEKEAKAKGQSISLKVNSTYANGKDGFFWFQVVVNMGKAQLPKMNIKVEETTYAITIRDDKTGKNITEEEYLSQLAKKD